MHDSTHLHFLPTLHHVRKKEKNDKGKRNGGAGSGGGGKTIAEDTVKVCAHVEDLRVLKDPAINEVAKLLAQHIPSDDALYDIRSIDAIHATCPDHGFL
jgi:hypothetical protein